MGFTKHRDVVYSKSTRLKEPTKKVITEKTDDGYIQQRVVYETVDLEEVGKTLIRPEDYTLEALIAAGVPLQQMPIGSLLNPTDRATLDEIGENMSLDAYLELISRSKNEVSAVQTEVVDELQDTETPKE